MKETIEIPETIQRSKTEALRIADVGGSAYSDVYLMDCIEGMKHYPDNYFDLAVVDPPYGIGYGGRDKQKTIKYDNKKMWDLSIPEKKYFIELFRVSKNQIIWGANYFSEYFPLGKGIICWYKHQNGNFSQWELAYTSIGNAKFFDRSYQKDQYNKIHPTQKPIKLYDWIFKNYAKEGDKILDTHLGSGSSRIAANKSGLDFTGFEIDEDYFNAQEKRYKDFISQMRLF